MPKSRKTCIAITGSGGFVGRVLVEYYAKKGWQVRALQRTAPAKTKNVEYVEYDLNSKLDSDALKNVDYLVHAAYIKQDKNHPNAFVKNIEAAIALAKSAKENKIKHSVFISSMSAHEEAISSYGKQKLAIEKIFSGKGFTSIRSGLIIGNGGIVKQMAQFMKSKHVVPLVSGGKQPLQIIDVNDLAKVIDKLLENNLNGIFVVASPEVYTYKEFYEAIAKKLNTNVLFIPVPVSILIAAIGTINALHLPLAVNKDNVLGLKMLKSFKTEDDLNKIGVKLKTLKEALDSHTFS